MPEGFTRFPRTPHLYWLGSGPLRDDKLLAPEEAEALLERAVAVEEKVDGACVGISVGPGGALRVQSRGGYLRPGSHPQFHPLWPWLAQRDGALREALGADIILFGEWCYARHSVPYDALPDWFVAFDAYDRAAGRFWSRARRDELCSDLGVTCVPLLASGTFDRLGIEGMLGPSLVGSTPSEGVYLRWDEGPWLVARAKLVRPGWLQPDEAHWASRPVEPNGRAASGAARAAGGGR